MVNADESMLEWALRYAQLGWAVFPCHTPNHADGKCSCGRKLGRGDSTTQCSGKRPRVLDGFKAATTDEEQIAKWWGMWPDATIGTPTPAVLDVEARKGDGEHDGIATMTDLVGRHGRFDPLPPRAYTGRYGGSRGVHLYFQPGPATAKIAPGVEIRGEGGYVILPPSPHYTGVRYEWALPPDGPLPVMPAWIVDMVGRGSNGTGSLADQNIRLPLEPGSRNNDLTSLAFAEARLGRTAEEIYAILKPHADQAGYPDADLRGICERAAGAQRLRKIVFDPTQPPPLNEDGMHELLVRRADGRLRHTDETERWLFCTKTGRWLEDGAMKSAREMAMKVLRGLPHEAAAIPADDPAREAWLKFAAAKGTVSTSMRDRMLNLSTHDPRVRVSIRDLDTHPLLLGAPNGIVDLETGRLREHDPALMITKSSRVRYDPDAEAPRWLQFLQEITDGDDDLVDYLHRLAGYCATGLTSEEKFWPCIGSGGNGKGTFLETIMWVLGEHAIATPFSALELKKESRATQPEIVRLDRVRLVVASENDARKTLDEALIKQLTGGDRIAARGLYSSYIEFQPSFKILLGVNNDPKILTVNEAIRRRVRVIPFLAEFPAHERDDHLKPKLRDEGPGVLNWIVRGALEWQQRSLGRHSCRAVDERTGSYLEQANPLIEWISDHADIDPGKAQDTLWHSPAGTLRKSYRAWCQATRRTPISDNLYATAMEALGLTRKKTAAGIVWCGIRLRADQIDLAA